MRSTWRQGRGQEWRFHGAWTGGSSAASVFGPEGEVAASARDAARRDATLCSAAFWPKTIPSTLLRIEFSQIFQTELHQGLTTKLAHLTTLYKLRKGSRVLNQRIWHKLRRNLTEFSALVNSESKHWLAFFINLHFKPAMPLNMKVVSLNKTHNFCIGRI
jgi:hypothetical protein